MFSAALYAHVRTLLYKLHMRSRVQRASGIPCSLVWEKRHQPLGRFASRDRETISTSSRRTPGPITPGSGFAEGLCYRASIERSRGMGPGSRPGRRVERAEISNDNLACFNPRARSYPRRHPPIARRRCSRRIRHRPTPDKALIPPCAANGTDCSTSSLAGSVRSRRRRRRAH